MITTEKDACGCCRCGRFRVPIAGVPLIVDDRAGRRRSTRGCSSAVCEGARGSRHVSDRPPTIRHRRRIRGRRDRAGADAAAADARSCSPWARVLGRAFSRDRSRAPPAGAAQPRGRVSRAPRGGARGDRARHVRALRPAADRAAEVQHAVAASRCWRASSSRARSGSRRRTRRARACCFFTGHFGYWELQAIVHALRARSRWRCSRARSTTRCSTTCSRTSADAHRQHGDLPPRHDPARDARARGEPGVARADRSAHPDRDAVYVDFFDRPAATTSALAALALRTGAPVMPVFALPLPRRTLSG